MGVASLLYFSIATSIKLLLLLFVLERSSVHSMSAVVKPAVQKGATAWSPIAIKAAQDFTVSQRQKLEELGALNVRRPIRIIGEPIDSSEKGESNKDYKILHLQRHGQGYHNLICDLWRELGKPIDFDSTDPALNPVVRPELLDPPLTHLGTQQCRDRRNDLLNTPPPELVIVSPMLRCLQTAQYTFGAPPDGRPFVAHEGCREELGLLVGNKRRPLSEIVEDYPQLDVSQIDHEEDVLWDQYGTDQRETLLEKSERCYDFLTNFVAQQPERDIAIVTHSAYLFTMMNAVMEIDEEELRRWFLTSEVRSLKVRFVGSEEDE